MKPFIRTKLAFRTALGLGAVLATGNAMAIEYDLSGNQGPHSVTGDVGGTAIFANHWTQPAGTGVFEPFLTLDGNGQTSTGVKNIEQAYNTDGHTALYLDQLRPEWNTRLTIGDLAKLDVNGTAYYGFLLDANEPGGNKSLISIDNIRIYTSSTDNTASVGSDTGKLNDLGTLRWAMNDGLKNPDGSFNIDTWVKLDSAQDNIDHNGPNPPNGGSGQSDMIVYVPVSAFAGAQDSDYLWFYNLNGVHYTADKDLASESGFEEWRAIKGPTSVPDGGTTAALLGIGLLGLAAIRRKS
jgi:hypothetical protein